MDVLSPTLIHGLFHTYGLWVLFALVMLESTGIPLPGETALVTAALYAGSTHQIGIAWVVLVAALAAIVGDNIGYLIGRSMVLRDFSQPGDIVDVEGEPRNGYTHGTRVTGPSAGRPGRPEVRCIKRAGT